MISTLYSLWKACAMMILFTLPFWALLAQSVSYLHGLPQEDERSRALIEIPGGTLMMAGFSTRNGQGSEFILSRKRQGQHPEIIGSVGTTDPDFAYDLCYQNGYIYMVGESQSLNETDALFTQWDTLGNVVRTLRIGAGDGKGQMFKSISADGYGNFWIAGYQSDTMGGNGNDFWLVKMDTAGNLIYQTTFGSRENDYAQAVLTSQDGGCWVSGDSKETGDYDVHLYRFDNQGVIKWMQSFGDAYDDGAQGLSLLENGDLLITGESVPALNAPFDFLFIRLDSANGNATWLRRAGGSGGDAAFESTSGYGGDILFCGYSNSYTPGPVKIIFGKLDAAGNLLYTEDHGGLGINLGYDIIQMQNGQTAIAGFATDTLSDCFMLISDIFTGRATSMKTAFQTLKMYPNPACAGDLVTLSLQEQVQDLKLFTIEGKEIFEVKHPDNLEFALPEHLSDAPYHIVATGYSGKIYSSWIYVHKHLD